MRKRFSHPGLLGMFIAAVVLAALLPPARAQTEDLQRELQKRLEALRLLRPLAPEEALANARVQNKYGMLLRQIKVPKDADPAKPVIDFGFRDLREYAGHNELPAGHWVYVYPHWYIWRDVNAAPKARRAWGPEQVVGPPNTIGPGDIQSAWASQTTDEQDEWLLCEYAEPVVPSAILIYETYNPGALNRVSVFKLDGTEVEVWKGQDPTPPENGHGVSIIPCKVEFKVTRVKIYLSSPEYPGYNEIDAVGLRDTTDRVQWAGAVEASSTYAQQQAIERPFMEAIPASDVSQRIDRLEREVREMKESMNEMRKAMRTSLEEIKELLKKKEQ